MIVSDKAIAICAQFESYGFERCAGCPIKTECKADPGKTDASYKTWQAAVNEAAERVKE